MSPSDIAALGADEAPAAQSGQLESQKTQIETLLAYTEEIERAIAANLEYAALALALALPDICVSLESNGRSGNGRAYAEWCERYHIASSRIPEGEPAPFMTGRDLWELRCAFLHNGTSDLQRPSNTPDHVLLRFKLNRKALSPGGGMIRVRDHNERSIAASAESICIDIVRVARIWVEQNAQNRTVRRNLETLLNLDRVQTGGVMVKFSGNG
jgi:hypothetical protein